MSKGEEESTSRVKISVILDAEDFNRFDRYCTEKGFKKSTLAARLIREHMLQDEPAAFGAKKKNRK